MVTTKNKKDIKILLRIIKNKNCKGISCDSCPGNYDNDCTFNWINNEKLIENSKHMLRRLRFQIMENEI